MENDERDMDLFDEHINPELDKRVIGELDLLLGLMARYASDGEKFKDTYRLIASKLAYLEKRVASLRAQFDTFPKPKP